MEAPLTGSKCSWRASARAWIRGTRSRSLCTSSESNTHEPRVQRRTVMKEMLTNKILTGLRSADFERLMPLLQPVSLSAGERLSEAGETVPFLYFPESCVLSCQAEMQDGRSAEVGMIGVEGMAGITALV